MKILLHTCCGPCSLYPLRTLRAAGHAVTGYFYNPNIHPFQEYERRRNAALEMARHEGLELVMRDEYGLVDFVAAVAGAHESRCNHCYQTRLEATAAYAAAHGFDAFTASLLYSRHQQHDVIREFAEQAGLKHGIPFYYEDFRSGWQTGIDLSKEMGLYRQQYCGCIYSEKDRYMPVQAGHSEMVNRF